MLYFASPVFIKLALLVLYRRINPTKPFRWCVYAVGILIVVPNIILACLALWDSGCNPKTSDGTCLVAISIAQAVLNISSDLVLMAMPLPTVASLTMPVRQKMAIYAIFILASGYVCTLRLGRPLAKMGENSAVITSIARFVYVLALRNNPDVTWAQGKVSTWSIVEVNIGIMCNCLLLLRPFVRRYLPWLVGHGSDRKKSNDRNRCIASRSIGGEEFTSWRPAARTCRVQSYAHASAEFEGIHVENEFRIVYENRGIKPTAINIDKALPAIEGSRTTTTDSHSSAGYTITCNR